MKIRGWILAAREIHSDSTNQIILTFCSFSVSVIFQNVVKQPLPSKYDALVGSFLGVSLSVYCKELQVSCSVNPNNS